MNPDAGSPIDECNELSDTSDYLSTLRPADDLLVGEIVDESELDVLRSLAQDPYDLNATARLVMIDVNDLPAEVRANLGSSLEDESQAVA